MTKEQYKKLNNYLKIVFTELEKNDKFLIDNLLFIYDISYSLNKFLEKYELQYNKKQNDLTDYEICLYAEEILNSIDKKYLRKFKSLIENFQIQFIDKPGVPIYYKLLNSKNIYLYRESNYTDVQILIHEFMHYINDGKIISKNRNILTEFLSIYFELYSARKIMEKNIPREELDYNFRLINTNKMCESFQLYAPILIAYREFGKIDRESANLLNKGSFTIDVNTFDDLCIIALNHFEKKENEYIISIDDKENFNQEDYNYNLYINFSKSYGYILGTMLAFYATKYCKMEDIIYLNDHINDEKYAMLDLYDVLLSLGINIKDNRFFEKSFESMDDYIKKYNENFIKDKKM